MSTQYFDRYQYFEQDGDTIIVPGLEIPIKSTDKYITFIKNKDRLDKLSQEYYASPLFGWVIMASNPLAGSLEFDIPDNFVIRVQFPLIPTLQDYKRAVDQYYLYYGKQ